MVTDNNNVKENSKGKVRSFNSRPDGKNDRGGRWYPSETEECGCCQSIRKPSRSWPSSLYKHCTTKAHYLNLCKKLNADPVDLPGKPQKKKVDEMIGYKVCYLDDNGGLYSIYQRNNGQAYEWIPNKWIREKIDNESIYYGENPQSGLWYFDNMPDALMFASKNLDSDDVFVLYECKCRYCQKFPSELYKGKYICSMIKLDKELYRDTVENICYRPLENIAYEINKGGN